MVKIGYATLEFTDILPNDVNGARPPSFRKRVTTDTNGTYTVSLPARNYKVQVISFTPSATSGTITYVDPTNFDDFHRHHAQWRFNKEHYTHDTTLDLIYHRPPVLKLISGLGTLCNGTNRGFALFNQDVKYSFN